MNHITDPRDAGRYDNARASVVTTGTTSVAALGGDPNRVAVTMSVQDTGAWDGTSVGMLGYMDGATFVELFCISLGAPSCTGRVSDYGPAIQRPLVVRSVGGDATVSVVDMHLINRD